MNNQIIVITGGAGFIGSCVVRKALAETEYVVVNVDKITYAGNLESLGEYRDADRHIFEKVDICDDKEIKRIFSQYKPCAVMHLAAESHVDRSIDGPGEFIDTNVLGTYTLLENARQYWEALGERGRSKFRFHHVSTDEVYGSLGPSGYFTEETPYQPNSPYSASKAASDHLVRAWWKTYGVPTVISNCSNNYGPYQFPEKLIPLMVHKALNGEALPVYGKGDNIRDWLYVEDHARALLTILEHGVVGEMYNVGGHTEMRNIDVVRQLCALLDELAPRSDDKPYSGQIEFVTDRPGHDRRYAIDAAKIERELGWQPNESFESGLRKTLRWYLDNQEWCGLATTQYRGERLGVTSGL